MPHILKVCIWLQMPVTAAIVKCYMLNIMLFNITIAKITLHCSQINEVSSSGEITLTDVN